MQITLEKFKKLNVKQPAGSTKGAAKRKVEAFQAEAAKDSNMVTVQNIVAQTLTINQTNTQVAAIQNVKRHLRAPAEFVIAGKWENDRQDFDYTNEDFLCLVYDPSKLAEEQ